MSSTLANHVIKVTLEAENKASKDINQAKRDLEQATKAGKENQGSNLGVVSGLNTMGGAFKNTGGKMQQFGKDHRALAVGVVAGSVKLITSSNDYNKTLAQTVMMSDDVELASMSQEEAMAFLNDTVDEMRQTYKTFSKQDIADEFYEIAKSGYSGADATDILNASLALATATGEDASVMTDVMISALSAFGLEASDAGDSAQYLANAANASRMDVSDMLTALNLVGAVAKDAGMSLEDTANYMGYLRQNGMSASTASTGLRQTLMNLTAPTEGIQDRFNELGIALHDSEGNFRGVETVMGDYRTATEGASDSVKDMDAKLIAGKTGAVAWKTLIDDAGGGVKGFAQDVVDGQVPLDEMVETMNDNDPWGVFKANLQDVAVNLGQTLAPILIEVLNAVNDFLQRINEDEEFRNHVAQVMKVVGAFAIITQVVGVVGGVITGLGAIFTGIGTVISFFGTIITGIGAVLTFLMTPVGLVTGVIALLSFAFSEAYQKSETFRNIVNGAIGAVADFVEPAVTKMKDWFGSLAEKFGWVADIFTAVKEVMKGVWDSITGFFKKGKKDATKEMDDMGKETKATSEDMKNGVEKNTSSMADKVKEDSKKANQGATSEFSQMSDTVTKETAKSRDASKANTEGMSDDIAKNMKKAESDVKASSESITKTISTGTKSWNTAMASGFSSMGDDVANAMKNITSKIVLGMKQSTVAVSDGSGNMSKSWSSGLREMTSSTSIVSGMVSSIYSITSINLYDNGRNAMISFGNGLSSGLGHVYSMANSASEASRNMSESGMYRLVDTAPLLESTMETKPMQSSASGGSIKSITGMFKSVKSNSSTQGEDTPITVTIVQTWDGKSVKNYIQETTLNDKVKINTVDKTRR